MKTTSYRARTLACALLATTATCGLTAAPALAQTSGTSDTETARRYDAVSPGGVSYPTGAYNYNIDLLSIGEGAFPRSLGYSLHYNSGGARHPNRPWAHNLTVRMSRTLVDDPASSMPEPDGKPHPEWQTWLHNVVMGQRSVGFEKYNANPGSSDPYVPVTPNGESLSFTPTDPQGDFSRYHGYFTFTGKQGELITFRNAAAAVAPNHADTWLEPDGTRLKYNYTGSTFSIESNRGYAIFFEAPVSAGGTVTSKVCALNLTQHHLPSITACPAGVQAATVVAQSASPTGFELVTSATMPDGGAYTYQYSYTNDEGVERRHLNCVKQPEQSACMIANSYDVCDGPYGPAPGSYDLQWTGSRDRVILQTFATGETLSYSYSPSDTAACRGNASATMTDGTSASTTVGMDIASGAILQVSDPLSRSWSFGYTGGHPDTFTDGSTMIATETSPEGDIVAYSYDGRGNRIETRRKAKPGSGLADIVTTAFFPATCGNRKTCNKPEYVTDAKGNRTDFTYDPTHGGVLTETGPAVNSVRPQKRYKYAQKYAYVKNSSGGYVQASSPVWLLTETSECVSGNSTSGPLVGGCLNGSEVKTVYDYGPASGPNNLNLRGTLTTGPSVNARTCYGYDQNGRRISETGANANLTSCPA